MNVLRKNGSDWVKWCMAYKAEGIDQLEVDQLKLAQKLFENDLIKVC